MTKRILFVDDEPKILTGLERQLGGIFEMQTAPSPEIGLQLLRQDGPFAVVVSDFRMPGMNGIQFLSEVKHVNADTVRVMLTGQADLGTAIAAVNEGSIFRFLTKPCAPETLTAALDSAIEQHRLITAERELLEKTLRGSVKVLTEVLSLLQPEAFRHACLLRKYVAHIATHLALKSVWEFELAAMLCQLGYITVPQHVLNKVAAHERLTAAENAVFTAHPAVAERLLQNIPRLETVGHMIRNQGSPPSLKERANAMFEGADAVTLGTAVLRAALEFDRLVSSGKPHEEALAHMRQAGRFHSRMLQALETIEIQNERQVLEVRLHELHAGMIAHQNILTHNGLLLVPNGEELTVPMIEKLRGFAKTVGIPEPLSVVVVSSPQC
jgi:CheY-like chemotaxis protein